MAPVARVGAPTSHPGVVQGPGVPTVLVEGLPIAVVLDVHVCGLLPPAGPHPPSTFSVGSATVFAAGRPILRMGDASACGASILFGALTVEAD